LHVGIERILPILVQFGVGAVLCGIGVWAGLKSGYLDLELKRDRKIIVIVVIGYLGLLLFYSAFTFWLPYVLPEPEL